MWERAQAEGELPASALDERDGFVHLSTAAQVPATLARFFTGREDLLVLSVAIDRLDPDKLRHEPPSHAPDPRGELFPHYYGRVPLRAIVGAEALPLDPQGVHRLPPCLMLPRAHARDS